jgi:hypothetical protein
VAKYASYLTKLSIDGEPNDKHAELYSFLRVLGARNRRSIFSSLKKITFSSSDNCDAKNQRHSNFSLFMNALSPSVQIARFDYEFRSARCPYLSTLMHGLANEAPNLRDLRVFAKSVDPSSLLTIQKNLTSMRSLRALRLVGIPLSSAFIDVVASIPMLEKFISNSELPDGSASFTPDSPHQQALGFLSAKSIRISDTFAILCKVVQSVATESDLEELVIELWTFFSLTDVFLPRFNPGRLRMLAIHMKRPVSPLLPHELTRLSHFPLRNLRLLSEALPLITNEDAISIFQQLPHLSILLLVPCAKWRRANPEDRWMSLSSFKAILGSCPDLVQFEACLDISPTRLDYHTLCVPHSKISNVNLGTSYYQEDPDWIPTIVSYISSLARGNCWMYFDSDMCMPLGATSEEITKASKKRRKLQTLFDRCLQTANLVKKIASGPGAVA